MQRVIGILVAVVIGGGVYMYRSSQRDAVEAAIEAMPEKMMNVIQKCAGYDKYESYVLDHAEAAHDHAMSVAFEPGGRRRSPKFDGRKYALAFSESLVTQGKLTRTDQKLDLFLRQLQIDIEKAAGSGEFD